MTKSKTSPVGIQVQPNYIPERSDPSKPIFIFSYRIKITNYGQQTIQLRNRYWHIQDGNGNIEEIRGPGVVGKKPFIKPGDSYEYTSFCPIPTEFGVMHGHFGMINEHGKKFNAKISPFRLSVPFSIN